MSKCLGIHSMYHIFYCKLELRSLYISKQHPYVVSNTLMFALVVALLLEHLI